LNAALVLALKASNSAAMELGSSGAGARSTSLPDNKRDSINWHCLESLAQTASFSYMSLIAVPNYQQTTPNAASASGSQE
jgi:hypothetical protein